MFGFDIDHARTMFFDRQIVLSAEARAKRRVLSRFGAFVRRTARTSIRVNKGTSKPGRPPYSHENKTNAEHKSLRDIYFVYDKTNESVIVGPAKLHHVFKIGGSYTAGAVPGVLEHGGSVGIFEVFRFGEWGRFDLRATRRLAGLPTRTRHVTIAPRPFMAPALNREIPRFAGMWTDSIRRAG